MDTAFVTIDNVMEFTMQPVMWQNFLVSRPAAIQEVSINEKHDAFFDTHRRCKRLATLTSNNYRLTPNLDHKNFRQLFTTTA